MEEKKQVRTRHDAFTNEAFFPDDEEKFIFGEGCRVLIMPKHGDIINEKNVQNTSQTKYFLTSEAEKIGYFMHHSSVWQSCEWQEKGKESPVRYRLIITLKCADTETENNALALMTTRFRFSLITATKSGLVFRSCKYSKLQAFNLYDIAKRFEIADFAVTCHDLNDGYIEDVTEDFIDDDIKKIQKHRAKYMVLSPLYSKVKDRIIKKAGLANVAKRGKGFKEIGKKYAK